MLLSKRPDFKDLSIREYVKLILEHEKVKKVLDEFHVYRRTVDLIIDSVNGLQDNNQFHLENEEDDKVLKKVLEDIEMVKKPGFLRILEPLRDEISQIVDIHEKRMFEYFVNFAISDVFSIYLIKETLPYFPKGTIGFVRKIDELISVFCLYIWMLPQFHHTLSRHRKNVIYQFAKYIRHDGSGEIGLVFDDPLSWSSIKVDNKQIVVDEIAINLLNVLFSNK